MQWFGLTSTFKLCCSKAALAAQFPLRGAEHLHTHAEREDHTTLRQNAFRSALVYKRPKAAFQSYAANMQQCIPLEFLL